MRNKKGSAYLAIPVAILFFAVGILFISFVQDSINATRQDLSCSDTNSISDGTKITCLMVDTAIPYLIWSFASIALGFIIGSSVGGQPT